ncbi:polyribonucleotide nucleotidyltransferase [Methanobrevibacter cuticularis]|uniref:Exosome complex component Rrp4 n=1 Tax=Methanobrevibacter cuticularis TaxID=47311 RepID=A0A166CJH9_9EURY|nr:polyribonucleotide nucleotidyltransferase [Methanobrevibacter cuticularis]
MYMIHVKDKELVVPGEILAEEGYYSGRGTFKDGDKVCSSLMGLVSLRSKKISVIPLKSKYVPKKGDVVIGEIDDIRFSMWGVDINSPYSGILPASEVFGREKKELSKVFKIGDVLFLRVVDVDEVKKVKLGLKGRGMGKFRGGILVDITPTKVPRLIGKKGSMINMIKDKTKCKIVVGQNGLVWVKGEKEMEQITKNIINLIEAEAHTSGLTNRIRDKLYLLVDGEIPEESTEEFEIGIEEDINDKDESSEIKVYVENDETGPEHTLDDVSNSVLENPELEDISGEVKSEKDTNDSDSNLDDANKDDIEEDNNTNAEKLSDTDKKSDSNTTRKINFLDTFDHLKSKKKSRKSFFGSITKAEDSGSPTINISNNDKK